MVFVALQESALDAVDGSSTGTRVPKMWVPFKGAVEINVASI
jgi:hypothetical protein